MSKIQRKEKSRNVTSQNKKQKKTSPKSAIDFLFQCGKCVIVIVTEYIQKLYTKLTKGETPVYVYICRILDDSHPCLARSGQADRRASSTSEKKGPKKNKKGRGYTPIRSSVWSPPAKLGIHFNASVFSSVA